jgi:hypothetical protein
MLKDSDSFTWPGATVKSPTVTGSRPPSRKRMTFCGAALYCGAMETQAVMTASSGMQHAIFI